MNRTTIHLLPYGEIEVIEVDDGETFYRRCINPDEQEAFREIIDRLFPYPEISERLLAIATKALAKHLEGDTELTA